ncbi:MAG: SDR family NAD(P)-dependent oxidoreductase [Candidatus Methylarchaceae archaeon HK01M]|nr:SDR family NAD(P)-dependent oxidoreductase [Candidatus Methylarchaceae archaeon HK01M]
MSFVEKDVLVTGGAGFIGSNCVKTLAKMGAKVSVLDNFQSGSIENLKHVMNKIRLVNGDVRDFKKVKRLVDNCDSVVHYAANASVPASVDNPVYDFETNVLGTLNILEAVRQSRNDVAIAYASSAALYGELTKTPLKEDLCTNPVSPYGISKLCGENYCRLYYKTYGVKTVSLRYFNVYGPHQSRYVMFDYLRKLSDNPNRLEILGSGKQVRDFIYVADAVSATLMTMGIPSAYGDTFNACTGVGTSVLDIAKTMLDLLGLKNTETVCTGKSWEGDVDILVGDPSKIDSFGFRPKYSLSEGLRELIKWYTKVFPTKLRLI